MSAAFHFAPQLLADTIALTDWPLCAVRLMDDARFPWLILVPRVAEASELFALSTADQTQAMREWLHAARLLQTETSAQKINLGALGNIVRQLHLHVVARNMGDAAWPGPVWGAGARQPYAPEARTAFQARLRALLQPPD